MSALLSNFVKKVQTKHWENLQRRTQRLDPVNRENLLDFLEDQLPSSSGGGTRSEDRNDKVKGSKEDDDENDWVESSTTDIDDGDDDGDDDFAEDDYELLQRDLDKANIKLEELESKRVFLQTRLQTYQSKIKAAEEIMSDAKNVGDNNHNPKISADRLSIMKEKIENYKTSLQPIQDIYQRMEDELSSHQLKIESMQNRQLELKLKTQECNVVLHELSYNTTRETTLMPNQGETETCEQLGLIENVANAAECLSLDDEQDTSNYNDVENPRIKEEEQQEIEFTNMADAGKAALYI